MLIEFSVSNFRSFREKQTFSMVAAPRLKKKGNTFIPEVIGEKLPELLKVAAIYGPNASGKSNLLKAMSVVGRILRVTPSAMPEVLPIQPFRFDKDLLDKPSYFEIDFIAEKMRYHYAFSATLDRIFNECLTSFPKGREVLLYKRTVNSTGEHYEFGPELEGGPDLHVAWKSLTAPKSLFLAQAVANSSQDLGQLRKPFNWLLRSLSVVTEGMGGLAQVTCGLVRKNPVIYSETVSNFLRSVDVPVTSVKTKEEKTGVPHENALAGNSKTVLTHKTALGEADFDFSEESEGTQGLIGFWLPWGLMSTEGGASFGVFAVDELDSSLHPEIVTNLIKRHLEIATPAQLIFSTHDTHLMDSKLLRRDQFWITERDQNGATQLRSIHDFDGREGEDIEKRYFEGRYRGLPILRNV